MKRRSIAIETPQKQWHPSFKSNRKKFHLTRTTLINSLLFLALFCITCGGLSIYYLSSSSFLSSINPLGKSPAFEKALHTELERAHIDVATEVANSDGSVMVKLAQNGTTVYFSPSKSAASQVSSLQAIATQLTIDGRKAYRIDFRFEVPVISSESL